MLVSSRNDLDLGSFLCRTSTFRHEQRSPCPYGLSAQLICSHIVQDLELLTYIPLV